RVNAQLLRHLPRDFVANDAAGNPLDVGQKVIHRLNLTFGAADGKLGASAFDEVIKILLRIFQRAGVCLLSLAPDEQVRVEAWLQSKNLDLKFFFDQQAKGALRSLGACRIRIEINHHVPGESSQKPGLKLGERSAGAGDDVVEAGGGYRDAVHLSFDEDGVVQLA